MVLYHHSLLERSDWRPEQWDATWPLDEGGPLPDGILEGEQDGTGRDILFDIEGNGLFRAKNKPEVTTLWCISAIDINTEEVFYWGVDRGPESIAQGLRFIAQARM